MMKAPGILVALSVAGAVCAAQQNDPLKTARDLYASAAYDEALSELAQVERDRPTPAAALETNAYRAFCLIALGRSGEAESILESLVRKDPLLTVDRYPDVSPRIAEQFGAVRQRLLPQLIREEYRAARASATEKTPGAQAQLTRVREMLTAAKDIDAWDETLDDLSMLVDGFLDLTSGAATTSASPALPAPAPPAEVPEAATPSPAAPVVFDARSTEVVPPVALSQQRLLMPRAVIEEAKRLNRIGLIQIVIDERGSVEDVLVRQSVTDAYDARVVASVRAWKFRPATKDGVKVKYVKTIAVTPHEQ